MGKEKRIRYDTSLSADIAIFTVHEGELKVMLVKRAHAPFEGMWALPGGFRKVGLDRTIEDVAIRRFKEETGVAAPYLEQLQTFSSENRDPRQWVTTVAYIAFMPHDKAEMMAGEGVTDVRWVPVRNGKVSRRLAFDHGVILAKAIERVCAKMEYSPIAAHVLAREFTIPELHRVYEIILDETLDPKHFRRSVNRSELLKETGRHQESRGHKPALLYRFRKGADEKLFFPRGVTRSLKKE